MNKIRPILMMPPIEEGECEERWMQWWNLGSILLVNGPLLRAGEARWIQIIANQDLDLLASTVTRAWKPTGAIVLRKDITA